MPAAGLAREKFRHDVIGVSTIADAILDRVIYNAYRIELHRESLRKRPRKAS